MFRNVASQVKNINAPRWQIVETGAYQEITGVLSDAQRWRNVTWVVGEAGCGKVPHPVSICRNIRKYSMYFVPRT